jgi:hypothetical protein
MCIMCAYVCMYVFVYIHELLAYMSVSRDGVVCRRCRTDKLYVSVLAYVRLLAIVGEPTDELRAGMPVCVCSQACACWHIVYT